MKQFHRWIRFAAAMLFWLNATALFRPALSPAVQVVATKLGIEFTSVSIILGLLVFSLLSLYGPKNTILSVIYIYTFPFIVTWHISRYIARSIRWMQIVLRKALPSPNEGVPLSELMPLWRSAIIVKTVTTQNQAPALTNATPVASDPKAQRQAVIKRALWISGVVLGRSTMLCGFLMVVSSAKSLIIASLVATSLGLIRTNILFLRNAFDVKRLTAFINDNFIKWIETLTQMTQQQINAGTNRKNPLGGIRMWKFLLNLIARAHEVPELLAVGGILVFAGSYAWVASVFYFIYLGTAKLTIGKAEWPTWLSSLLFPLMGSNIARTPLLTTFVVLHWLELALLAYVLWKFLATEIDRFRKGILKYEIAIDDRIKILEVDLAKMASTTKPQQAENNGVPSQSAKNEKRRPDGKRKAKKVG